MSSIIELSSCFGQLFSQGHFLIVFAAYRMADWFLRVHVFSGALHTESICGMQPLVHIHSYSGFLRTVHPVNSRAFKHYGEAFVVHPDRFVAAMRCDHRYSAYIVFETLFGCGWYIRTSFDCTTKTTKTCSHTRRHFDDILIISDASFRLSGWLLMYPIDSQSMLDVFLLEP